MFHPLKDPPQWLLDGLLQEHMGGSTNCPDCAVKPGENHHKDCDAACCLKTGRQRLSCNCGNCGDQIWTGLWSGVQQCYDNGWVVYDTSCQCLMFDINRAVVARQITAQQL